ncbi:MAG: cbb3-type cytochrome c oxidase subunit 3 [Verrucomicrobiae bacterium]|nr:cbb3-type cytochrome c oxidase subunit 3 [Verrucomicrobiae bacterium]
MLYNLAHSILSLAGNINAYGLFSFFLFFGFFTGVLIWAFWLKKNHLNYMGRLPLDGGEKEKESNPEKL